jgi:diacylglycerol kinase (ATP)
MRRAILLYNPHSGRPRNRLATIARIADALQQANLAVRTVPTHGPNTAGHQAAALADTTDILFACGGDGTIHEVLQGLAHHATCTLGIIPLGSANALARHLNLSLDPVQAALQQLNRTSQTIPIGKITFTTPDGQASRYFLVMAGAGPDGMLVYKMLTTGKHMLGRMHYYLSAAWLFVTTRFSTFTVTADGNAHEAVSALAVRVADLGGLFSPLVRGASIDHPHLTLSIATPPAALSLPAWFATSWARLQRLNPYSTLIATDTFHCGPGLTNPIQVQADGEHLGTTPMTVGLIPNALRLLLEPEK